MVVSKKNLLLASTTVALAVNFSACTKDSDSSQTDKLIGEWEIVSILGQTPEYATIWEFQGDMNFEYCYTDADGTYCYQGDWEWTNDAETEVKMEATDGGYTTIFDLKIDKLTEDVLEGDVTSDGFSAPIELKKLN